MKAHQGGLGAKLTYFVVAVAAATAGFGLHHMWNNATTPSTQSHSSAVLTPTQLIGQQRPAFTLRDLNNKPVSIGEWDGKVILINFWATWCPPCRKEIPTFVETLKRHEHRGFRIVGIAIDERDAVEEFVKSMNANYPQLMGGENGIALAKRYGNRYGALPYSVLVDRTGVIRFIKPGELHRKELESQLERLL